MQQVFRSSEVVISGHIECRKSGDTLLVKRSRRGRLLAAFYRGVTWFPLIMGGLGVFFLPDYIGRFAEQEPVPGLFWGSLAGLALLIAFLAGTVRFLRRESWVFDGSARVVAAEMKTLWLAPGRGEVEMREIEALMLNSRRWPRRSELHMRLDSGVEEVVFSGRGISGELEELAQTIVGFMREQRYQIELLRDGEDE